MKDEEELIDKIIPLGKTDLNQFLDFLGKEKVTKEEILNAFLLANIPEIITQEEFDNVKKAIFELLKENKKYKKVIDKLKEYLQNNSLGIDIDTDNITINQKQLLDILGEM